MEKPVDYIVRNVDPDYAASVLVDQQAAATVDRTAGAED
jgi:hypothetical protein